MGNFYYYQLISGLRFSYLLLQLFGNFNLLVDFQVQLLILIIGYLKDLMIMLILLLYMLQML